jgi:hypothetical protein
MALDQSFVEALLSLGRVFERYRAATSHDAVLVGGAAVNILTAGAFHSGDFDIQAAGDEALEAAFLAEGFRAEDRRGKLRIGFYHPRHPAYGFQQVSGALMDGRAERRRLFRVRLARASAVALPAVEDLIADRLAQFSVAAPGDMSRLLQARALLDVLDNPDLAYLRKRVAEEGGDMTFLRPDTLPEKDA